MQTEGTSGAKVWKSEQSGYIGKTARMPHWLEQGNKSGSLGRVRQCSDVDGP